MGGRRKAKREGGEEVGLELRIRLFGRTLEGHQALGMTQPLVVVTQAQFPMDGGRVVQRSGNISYTHNSGELEYVTKCMTKALNNSLLNLNLCSQYTQIPIISYETESV
jgi:hypothetical protein